MPSSACNRNNVLPRMKLRLIILYLIEFGVLQSSYRLISNSDFSVTSGTVFQLGLDLCYNVTEFHLTHF